MAQFLRICAANGDVAGIRQAMKDGDVDIDAKDGVWWTAIHHAAANGHCEAIDVLVEEFKADVQRLTHHCASALHWAAQNGHSEAVKHLVTRYKLPINAYNDEKLTPLMLCCMYCETMGHVHGAEFLLQHGAAKDATNFDGKSARDLACICGKKSLKDALLKVLSQ